MAEARVHLYFFLIGCSIEDPAAHIEHKDGWLFFVQDRLTEEVFVEYNLWSIDKDADIGWCNDLIIISVATFVLSLLLRHRCLALQLLLTEIFHALISGLPQFFEVVIAADNIV